MVDQTITCPNCKYEIPLTEALTEQIRQRMQAEVDQKAKEQQDLVRRKEESLDARAKQLDQQEKSIEVVLEQRLKQESERISKEAREKVSEEFALKLNTAKEELEEKREQVRNLQKQELELRKAKQVLEEEKESLDLEVQRRVDEERKKIQELAFNQAAEQQKLRLREKDDLILKLKEQLEESQRRIEQGSQERQGEVLEEELAESLQRFFSFDVIEEIQKGARGADVLQKVRNSVGKECGSILWESKNAKDFKKSWIEKLRKDQQDAKADIAVLMSVAVPPGVRGFDFLDEIWVSDFASAMSLCVALRQTLIRVERERIVAQHQDSLKDIIYQYITGQEFANRVKMIVSAYKQMQADLESEKRSYQRIWKKREKQIATVLDNITEMYGEIEGSLGGQKLLPAMDTLSLESIAEEDDRSESQQV